MTNAMSVFILGSLLFNFSMAEETHQNAKAPVDEVCKPDADTACGDARAAHTTGRTGETEAEKLPVVTDTSGTAKGQSHEEKTSGGAGADRPASGAHAPQAHGTDSHGRGTKNWSHTRAEQVASVMGQPLNDKAQAMKPAPVELKTPKFLQRIDGTEVQLEWAPSEKATLYHVQVSKDAGFNNRSMYVSNEDNLGVTNLIVKNLEPGTRYFWRVAARNPDMREGYTKSNFTSSSFTTK